MPRLLDPAAQVERAHEIWRLREVEGLTLSKIGARFGITEVRVHAILKTHATALSRPIPPSGFIEAQARRRNALLDAARAGASNAELAERFGTSRKWLNHLMRKHGIERHGGFLADPDLCPPRTVAICEMFYNGIPAEEIARRFGITRGGVLNHLRNAKLRSLGLKPNSKSPGLNPVRNSSRSSLRTTRKELAL